MNTDYSLDFKLGQMLMVGFRGATIKECEPFLERFAKYRVGGVWLTDNESPLGLTLGNVRSPEQLKTLTAAIQERVDVPLFIAIDAEGGEVIRMKEKYGFPPFVSPREIGERDDPEFTREHAARLASTLKEMGINFSFAPVVDLNTNPDNPIIGKRGRAFCADAATVVRHASICAEALHKMHIMVALKHFPGHGSSSTDSHLGMVDVSAGWTDDDIRPYRELNKAGLADGVLSAHIYVKQIDPDYPATLSHAIMTGLLRDQIGFEGVAFSDDLNMGAIREFYSAEEATARALNAGVDVILHSNTVAYDERIIENSLDTMRRLVETGKVSEKRIDASFRRIMSLKRRFGLA